jgi:peroxiredoxin
MGLAEDERFSMVVRYPVVLQDALKHARDADASLNERLECFAEAARSFSASFADAVDRLTARLRQHGTGLSAPAPGDAMPPFVLTDDDGQLVTLDEVLNRGPVALAFHRGHWCPYCRINTSALAAAQIKARASGGQIVAIMPERQRFTIDLKSDAAAPFPILTDLDNAYALPLNLAFSVGDEMKRLLKNFGLDLPSYQGNDAWMLPIPATFVVGTDGRVTARFVDPDYRRRMPIEDMLGALRNSI